ncbi:FecR family protein [Pseudomonas sp. RA_35y_Pfl2_P32]|uniref:FecR family protein n=1 Tax=Pseudomonas sp. RA_35y_Pfl2_P32 TaxID=3088705 RepID=UPI0030DBBF23
MKPAIAPQVLRQAAEWLVRLDHGSDADAQTEQQFRAWLAADPLHREAIARLQGHLAPLQELPARAALRRAQPAQRRALGVKGLALLAVLGLTAGTGYPYWQSGYLLADHRTDSRQWRHEYLADGSQLQLDSSSAVDLDFDSTQRRVRLLEGEILVDVAKDAHRPFYVDTPHGTIRALGTRFIVERNGDATLVSMLESSTRIDSGGRSLTLNPGQRVRFDAQGLGAVSQVDGRALQAAWSAHQLLAHDQSLADVLTRIARHHRGLLIFDRQALQALRVTAILPADDSDRALRLLARTLPIEVKSYSPWITRVSLKRETE